MPSVDNAGFKFGQIIVDKETGRTKVTQELQGIDLGAYYTKLKEAKMVKVEKQQEIIETNTQKLAALSDFKSKVLSLDKAVATMANRLGAKEKVQGVLHQKAVSVDAAGPTPFEKLLSIDYFNETKVGSFTMKINQVATADSYRTKVTVPDLYTDLGLNGTFTIGTIAKDSSAQVMITAGMSMTQIIQAINTVSEKTGVTADVSLISPSDPTGYELRLSTKQLSTPIVLQDDTGGILTGWNMIPNQRVTVQSGPEKITTDKQANLGISGSLVVGAGSEVPLIINTGGLALQDIADQINNNTATYNVMAKVVPVYAANALSADLPVGYQLSLSTINNQPLNLENSDVAVINGLQLKSAINTSFNSIVSAADPNVDQGLTGNFVIKAGAGGASVPIETTGKSLNQLIQEINDKTQTTGVIAKLQVMIPANPSTADSENVYQLTLVSNNGTPLITSGSDASVIAGLGLDAPTHDFQAMVAKINVNGVDYQRFTNTVDNVVSGVTLNLKNPDPATTLSVDITESIEAAGIGIQHFITAYNDLNAFYNKHTAMKADFSGPAEGALLSDDLYVKSFMQQLKQKFSTVIVGPNNGSLISLSSIGLRTNIETGALAIEDEALYNNALTKDYNKLVALFENTITSNDSNFYVADVPSIIDSTIAGKDIKIALTKDSISGLVSATIKVGNETLPYKASVAVVGTTVTIQAMNTGTSLDSFKFQYSAGEPASGQTVETTINIVPGIMAQIDEFLLIETNPNKVERVGDEEVLPPYDVKGAMLQNISSLDVKKKKLAEDVEQLKKSIEKEMESVERRFDVVLKSKANYEMIQGLLKSFLKANSR